MKKFNSLKSNEQFKYVYNNGKSYANKLLVMYMVENSENKNRIGISVSKKVGNSVIRHHITRLLRECFRLNEFKFNKNVDMVVIVRNPAKDATYNDILKAYLHLCGLHKILKEMV